MSINELKSMNENERMEWIVSTNAKDLGFLLQYEGVKGVSKMKKAEKVAMIVRLVVENVADEDTKRIMEKVKKLNEEIEVRQSYAEKIEWTLYAMYKNNEITYNELRKVCNAYNMDIPLSCNEKNSIKLVDKHCNFSKYKHHDEDNNAYYSLFDKCYEWDNVCISKNMCEYWDFDWDVQQFYEKNTVDNGDLQLAYTFDDDGDYILCVYKDYELLGTYFEGDMHRIKKLVDYDDKLVTEDLDAYEELLELLNKQQEELWEIIEADRILRNKLNCTQKSSRQLIIDELNRSKNLNSNGIF